MVSTQNVPFSTLLILILHFTLLSAITPDETTLKLVAAVFRHGDRTNDASTVYPNDPHANETYFPNGVGQLTNKGKLREYKLGKLMRRRYGNFLGKLYNSEVLDAVSTEMNRTKASLALVLAGLYPPKGTLLEWEEELNWEPIPYNYLMFANDHMMSFALFYCSKYSSLYETYRTSPDGQKLEQKYAKLYPYLSYHAGGNITTLQDIFMLYFGLTSQLEWGLQLPEWSKKVYPEAMYRAASDFYVLSSGNTQLKQLSGGFLLKKIITDIELKLNGSLAPKGRKMFLYSGHEINVAYILRALEVFVPHVPHYGSCVLIEVHTINNVNGIKIYYVNYSGPGPKLLTIPGCDSFCPVKRFVELLNKNLPEHDNACDEDGDLPRTYYPKREFYLNL